MTDSPKDKQTRAPKLDYIERLVDSMQSRGAIEVTFGEFSVKFHPNFRPAEPETIEPANSTKEEAKQAVREAFEKVKRLSKEEDEDLYWSS